MPNTSGLFWKLSLPRSAGLTALAFLVAGLSLLPAPLAAQDAARPQPAEPRPPAAAAQPSVATPSTNGKPAEEGASALARGNVAEAITSFTTALADTSLSNDRRATLLNDRAVAYAHLNQIKAAITDFNAATVLFPEYAAVYNNRGNLLLTLGLPKESIKDFDRAIVLAPGYAAAFNNRAGAYVKLGQPQDAIRDYTRAIQLMPASPAPLTGRGRVHLSLMRPHTATRDFTRAVNLDARFASGYRNRAEAKLAVQSYDEAIEDLSRAIAFDVANAEIYNVRGQAYLALKNLASAIKDFSQAIDLNPKLASAYQSRGLAHGLAEAYDEAYADLNKAIELDPRSSIAFALRAYVYKLNGQLDIALTDIETAQKLGPDQPEVVWALAELDEAQGQPAKAIAHYRKALSLRPGYKDATEGLLRVAGPDADPGDTLVQGAGIEFWRVVLRANRYFAINDQFAQLSVPLEMLGEGKPKLIEWEVKPAPVKGIGVLRFNGGTVKTATGSEDIELVAIIDFEASNVIAIVPHKQGAKTATWTWESSRVVVAAVDGTTDEFNLRNGAIDIAGPAGAGGVSGFAGQRRYGANAPQRGERWAPWNQPWAGGSGAQGPRSQRTTSAAPKKKAKTLFDLLFH